MRYLVASKRYECTKAIRGILRSHFEDAFTTPEQVYEVAKELKNIAEHISVTVEVLLETHTSPTELPSASARALSGPKTPEKPFNRVWKIESDSNDMEAAKFRSWAALLLHLMVHKAYNVLYHPLFRDPAMICDTQLRTRYPSLSSRL